MRQSYVDLGLLLVDADLRKPQLHYRLGVNNLLGLSNLLTESDLHWQEVIQPVAGHESWSVLTADRVPPDPARSIGSGIQTLRKRLELLLGPAATVDVVREAGWVRVVIRLPAGERAVDRTIPTVNRD